MLSDDYSVHVLKSEQTGLLLRVDYTVWFSILLTSIVHAEVDCQVGR